MGLTSSTKVAVSRRRACVMGVAFGLRSRLLSFRYAGNGLRLLVWREQNARIHLAASLLVICSGFALRVTLADWRWLIFAMALVWMAEAFNTAMEALSDRICMERDVAIGGIKDLAAGAVLIAAIAAATIGLLTLLPYVAVAMS